MLRSVSRSLSRTRDEETGDEDFSSRDAARFERIVSRRPSDATSSFDQYLTNEETENYRASLFEALTQNSFALPTIADVVPRVAAQEALLPDVEHSVTSNWAQPLLASPPVAARVREALKKDRVLLRRPIPRYVTTPIDDKPDPLEFLDQLAPLPVRSAKPRRPQLHRNAISESGENAPSLRVQAIRRSHQEMLAREMSARPMLDAKPRRASEPLLRFNLPEGMRHPSQETPQEAERGRGRSRDVLPPQLPPPTSPLPPTPDRPLLPRKSSRRVSFARTGSGRSGSVPTMSRIRDPAEQELMQRPSARDFYLEMASLDWELADNLQLL